MKSITFKIPARKCISFDLKFSGRTALVFRAKTAQPPQIFYAPTPMDPFPT